MIIIRVDQSFSHLGRPWITPCIWNLIIVLGVVEKISVLKANVEIDGV